MARRQIPPERKTLYYIGMGVSLLGVLMFLSTFVTFLINVGNFDNFHARARSDGFRAFGGMFLIIVGGAMMNIAARGLAGSGVVLDPEKARTDVEPWTRMTGGMVSDALDEAGIDVQKITAAADIPLDEKIRRLHALFEDGLITREEYEREKREVLDNN